MAFRDEKQRIAEAIAAQIPDHASLFINIGTTTESIWRVATNLSRLEHGHVGPTPENAGPLHDGDNLLVQTLPHAHATLLDESLPQGAAPSRGYEITNLASADSLIAETVTSFRC